MLRVPGVVSLHLIIWPSCHLRVTGDNNRPVCSVLQHYAGTNKRYPLISARRKCLSCNTAIKSLELIKLDKVKGPGFGQVNKQFPSLIETIHHQVGGNVWQSAELCHSDLYIAVHLPWGHWPLYNVATLTASGLGHYWADQYKWPGIVPVGTEHFMTRLGCLPVVVTDGDSGGLRFHVDTMKQKPSPRGQWELFDST